MTRQLRDAVVVITGASSGIGRAAAHQFAKEGARLVLASRDKDALERVVSECAERGAQAIAVPTDTSQEPEVHALAHRAVTEFGRLDVWVNNAAGYLMGPFEVTPASVQRRLFEVNVFGYMYGAQAALAAFRKQDTGVLIQVGSMAGKVSYAYASAYCATKHAIHAYNEALRQELRDTDIHACIVAPGTVDTPLFQHAANYTGREVIAMRPIYEANRVAAAIVSCARQPRREVLVGSAPRMMSALQIAAPAVFERVEPKMIKRDHLGDLGAPATDGNLFSPLAPHAIEGGWKVRRSLGWRVLLAAAAAVVPTVLVARNRALRTALLMVGGRYLRRAFTPG